MKLNIQEFIEIDTIYRPEVLALKVSSQLSNFGSIHLTTEGEGFWFRENGLYNFLSNVTDSKNIKIDSWNLKENHDHYDINIVSEIYDCHYFVDPPSITTPNHFKVAALSGRANYNRLVFHSKLHKLADVDLVYTFHQDLMRDPWPVGMKKFVELGGDYLGIQNSTPRSDIGKPLQTPIIPPENIFGLKDVYNDIGLEVVIETVDQGFFVTEKTLRPIYFGRPFIIIGANTFEANLKKLGFEVDFNIPSTVLTGEYKIDHVISAINYWHSNVNHHDWFNSLIPKLKHNQKVLNSYAQTNGKVAQSVVDSLL